MATFSNRKYDITNIMKIYYDENGIISNIFDPKFVKLIKKITLYKEHEYNDIITLENISYKYYRTTSLYPIITLYNGIIHPLTIENGTILKIPVLKNINSIFTENIKKNRGTTVVI